MSSTRCSLAVMLAASLVALAPRISAAQDTSGVALVRGAVVDAGGRAAPDVALCVAATGQCDVTGADGRFSIAGVRAGRYQLEVIAPGTPAFLTGEIEVRAGLDALIEVALPDTTAVAETVTVTAPTFAFPEEVRNSGYLVTSTEILSARALCRTCRGTPRHCRASRSAPPTSATT